MNRHGLLAAACIALAACAAPGEPGGAPSGKQRIALQVSSPDPKIWNQTLNVADNLREALGADNVQIEIVAYGLGIGILKEESAVRNRILAALDRHVQVVACENTMTRQKLTKDDMIGGIGYVPAGVVEIMRRQQQGWFVHKP